MGEAADDIIEGAVCEACGQFFTNEHGYPVVCQECWREMTPSEKKHHQLAIHPLAY